MDCGSGGSYSIQHNNIINTNTRSKVERGTGTYLATHFTITPLRDVLSSVPSLQCDLNSKHGTCVLDTGTSLTALP